MCANKDPLAGADSSIVFSSPPLMSTPIKRPPRTYGRPRDALVDQTKPPNPSPQPCASAQAPGPARYGANALDLAQNFPGKRHLSRQSLDLDVADGQRDGDAGDASDGFQFGWKRKLKEIDEMTDEDGEDSRRPDAEDALDRGPHLSDRESPRIVPGDDAPCTVRNSPALQRSPLAVEDVFGSSLSTITASSETFEDLPSASPPPVKTRGRRRAAVISTSEDESEDVITASGQKARVSPHPITTPKSRPSSTPPTSDDEMPSRIASARRPKGKGKASASRIQVPALQFNGEPITSHKKRISEALPAHAKSKLKAPTKKEKLETVRDRGRIAGAQRAAIQPAKASTRVGLQHFFDRVQNSGLARTASSDDPITAFSSSPNQLAVSTTSDGKVGDSKPESAPTWEGNVPPSAELRSLSDSDDENPPDVVALLDGVKKAKTQAEKQKELKAMKLAALKQATVVAADDEDDDLQIIGTEAKEKDIKAKQSSGRKQNASEGQRRQMALGGISLAQQRAKQRESPPKPLAGPRKHSQLVNELAMLVAQNNVELTKKKEDEWVKRGGRVAEIGGGADESEALRNAALKGYAEMGQKNAEAREARMQFDLVDDEDPSDGDWSETRESASPRPQEDSDAEDADITMVNEEEEDDEEGASSHLRTRGPRRIRPVIDSDSENDENAMPLQKSASFFLRESILGQDNENVPPLDVLGGFLHRGSVSSTDERTEDEGDKENSTHLMYDRSEDKENKVVPRHPFSTRPGIGRQGSLFGLEEGIQRSLSVSPGHQVHHNEDGHDENDVGGDKRRPLQPLADEDPFLAEPGLSPNVDFAARLQQASPLPEGPLNSPESTLRPSFDVGVRTSGKAVRLSQFSDDGPANFKGAALQPGFSELFESGTEQQRPAKRPLGLSPSFSQKSGLGLFALRQTTASLGLTQDIDLQPAFEVGDHLKRQAGAIFEKEQEYVWEAANRKTETNKSELYVNDHGFLTQTRPDVATPEVYRPSSPSLPGSLVGTQRSGLLEPHSSLRRPLRTLSLTGSVEHDAPERSPMRRLAKRTRTPSPRSSRSSLSPTPAARTKSALDLLRREAIHAPRPKRPLEKSEYVAEEAQESDEDEMIAFGGNGEDGEEEDGEDLDRTLETLVDDQEMDQKTIAADLVLEKFQEQTHEDDLEIEKLHQAVAQGELRKKRRNRGLGMDDSDEEDEEDEYQARKMRRGFAEPKIDNKNVNELAKDPITRAFYDVYRMDLERGAETEFAYLEETQPDAAQDTEMVEEDGREMLTRQELTERIREVARQEEVEAEMDVDDVSWVDGNDSDNETQTKVKAISLRRGGGAEARNRVESPERKRMNSWAKTEGRSHKAGTGRASGRTAVTGQMAKARAGGGTLRTGGGAQADGKPVDVRKPLRPQPSVLAGVASERSARFI
ncbi:hypothetical protein B0H15DRAFT_842873 [Mycena belliarum]|uniref:DNA replication checkpoint mediator MRC1 domain-containing protein n=1 Tax=Mycena belliarum TaxID=1033014 RepID=A0AAD6U631_9AGAR|nr:hypothetical protein B0H15DRAFT_842873 [Mycena belliae]